MTATLKVMVVPVGAEPHTETLEADANGSYQKALENRVGGCLTAMPWFFQNEIGMFINGLGRNDLTPNRMVHSTDGEARLVGFIYGDFVCTSLDPNTGDVIDITDEDAAKVVERFGGEEAIRDGILAAETLKKTDRTKQQRYEKDKHIKTVKALLVPIGGEPYTVLLRRDKRGLVTKDLQKAVNGYFEAAYWVFDGKPIVFLNDMSKYTCMPNRAVYATAEDVANGQRNFITQMRAKEGDLIDIICGNFVCVGQNPYTGDVKDITDDEVLKVYDRFGGKRSIQSGQLESALLQEIFEDRE